jgi:hypothetical protein
MIRDVHPGYWIWIFFHPGFRGPDSGSATLLFGETSYGRCTTISGNSHHFYMKLSVECPVAQKSNPEVLNSLSDAITK